MRLLTAQGGLALAVVMAATLTLGAAPAQAACGGADVLVGTTGVSSAETSLHCLINDYRAANGRAALAADSRLAADARAHSQDMVKRDYFSHFGPDGSTPEGRALAAGFRGLFVGENITAQSLATPRNLLVSWELSPEHRANLLRDSAQVDGVGIAPGEASLDLLNGATATLVLGKRSTAATTKRSVSATCKRRKRAYVRAKGRLASARTALAKAKSPGSRRRARKRVTEFVAAGKRARSAYRRACR